MYNNVEEFVDHATSHDNITYSCHVCLDRLTTQTLMTKLSSSVMPVFKCRYHATSHGNITSSNQGYKVPPPSPPPRGKYQDVRERNQLGKESRREKGRERKEGWKVKEKEVKDPDFLPH